MKIHIGKSSQHSVRLSAFSVSWFFIFNMVLVSQFILPSTVYAFYSINTFAISKSSLHYQVKHLSNLVATATPSVNTNGTTSSQESQAQNDFSIANTIITLAGVVIALAGLVLAFITIGGAIAGFFGVREFRRLRKLRRNITTLEQKVKEQQEQLDKTTAGLNSNQELLGKTTINLNSNQKEFILLKEESEKLEKHLAQLKSEIVERKFLEAFYHFSEGTRLYRFGDDEHAIESYLRADKLQPESLPILERLGRAYINIDDMENASKYLNAAFEIDREDEAVLRSLAQCYRYIEPKRAIKYLESIVQKNDSAFESWDFLGLFYRDQLQQDDKLSKDQEIINKAIDAHERALKIKERPETEFYLSILLLFSPKGDKMYARELMIKASQGLLEKEHDQRIRPVWQILIQAGPFIIDGKKPEALQLIQSLTQYITTTRIRDALRGHIQFLLEGTNHADWIPEFLDLVKLRKP